MKANQGIVALCLFMLICLASQLAQAEWTQQAKLTPPIEIEDPIRDFGQNVSMDNGYAVVGHTSFYTGFGLPVYKLFGTIWVLQDELYPSDSASWGSRCSLSLHGDSIIIGNDCDSTNGSLSGTAYIFNKWYSEYWQQQAKIYSTDIQAGDLFGCSVAINGDYAVIGATGDDEKGSDAGAAYVFKRDGTTWTQQAKLLAEDGAASDKFGYSVAISGDTVVVGAIDGDSLEPNGGAAYVFKRDGITWPQQGILTVNIACPVPSDFGCSVSIDGDYIIVGDKNYALMDSYGAAFIFHRIGTSWIQQKRLIHTDTSVENYFGHAVSINGPIAIVGTYDDIHPGKAYVYHRYGVGWIEKEVLSSPTGSNGDGFGSSVSVSGNHIMIGSAIAWPGYEEDRSAYIYHTPCAQMLEADINGDCVVNLVDLSILANQWLLDGTQP